MLVNILDVIAHIKEHQAALSEQHAMSSHEL